ncbi:hypothetical protein D3C76_1196150 [compost metagenome]
MLILCRRTELIQLLLLSHQDVGLCLGYLGQIGQLLIIGIVKVECRAQIAANRTAIGADILLLHAKPGLDKTQHRGVIKYLGVNPASATPGRYDQCRHPGAGTIGAIIGMILTARIQGTAPLDLAIQQGWRGRRGQMIKEAVILIKVDNQHRFAP